ncbi:MAG: protein kinase [Deltaproteobacteria bacterium]|nr:protein kinase [Deltaproteobacteria bacterium]
MALVAGEILGRYEILRSLGRGGMAEVYLAQMRGLGGFVKEVALKCVLPDLLAEPELTQMFLDEARTAARLEHPNIVQVFDIGQEGGHLFFAMEYVRGTDARTLLRTTDAGGALPLGPAIAIVLGTAAASHHAHERGVIHRDISPSNVMISSAGIVKLTDFGIAKAASNRNVTQSGVIKGKQGYMSPEQCRGRTLDRRSDIYSLGVLLYQLTTGRLPFAETNPLDFVEHVLTRDPVPPSRLVERYPSTLEEIVLRAIAREPAERFATAAELERALEEVVRELGLDVSSRVLAQTTELDRDVSSAPLSPSYETASLAPSYETAPSAVLTAVTVPHARRLAPEPPTIAQPSPRGARGRRAAIGGAILAAAIGGGLAVHYVVGNSSSRPPSASSNEPSSSAAHDKISKPPSMIERPAGGALLPATSDAPSRRGVGPTPPSPESTLLATPEPRAPEPRAPARAQSGRARSRPRVDVIKKPAAPSAAPSTDPDAPLPGTWRPQ